MRSRSIASRFTPSGGMARGVSAGAAAPGAPARAAPDLGFGAPVRAIGRCSPVISPPSAATRPMTSPASTRISDRAGDRRADLAQSWGQVPDAGVPGHSGAAGELAPLLEHSERPRRARHQEAVAARDQALDVLRVRMRVAARHVVVLADL